MYDHQRKIVSEDPKYTGLFLGTGSGKTLTALCLARGKTLVICPKTQKEDKNWEREAHKNKLIVDLTVISKETFRRDWKKIGRFDTIIVDEAHTCLGVTPNIRWKNKKPVPKTSQIFEALESYIHAHKPSRLYLCTATIMRSPMVVWGASRLLNKQWDFYKFRNAFYFRLPMPGREVWTPRTDSEAKDALANIVRNLGYVGRLEDFFDVPDQTHKVVHVSLTDEQKKRIKDMTLEYPEPIVRIGKVHQIENGVLSGDEFKKEESFDNEKIEKILEYAIEFPKMIIFSKYRAQIRDISSALKAEGYTVYELTGDTKDRDVVIREVNSKKECILIAQAQISAGWEVPDCPVMIFASKTYSFVDYDQAIGRIQRANNIKKNLYIHLVVKGGIDEAVHDTIEDKKDFNERIYLNI